MSEARKSKKHAVETSRVAHRGTLTQAGILILLAGFVMYQSMFGEVAPPATQTVVPFKYYMLAVSIIVAGMNVGSILATLRGRQPLAYSLSYLSMFVFLLGVITLIQGRALFSTFFLLVAAALGLRWICPPHHKRLYFFATAIVLAIAWWIEWYNPAWRVVYSGAQVGPIAAIVFALIFSVFLALQAWQGNIRLKLATGFTAIALASVTILGSVTYLNVRSQMREDIRQRLLNMVSIAALQQDVETHAAITKVGDESTQAYQQIRGINSAIVATDPDIVYLYTMRMDENGQIYFVVDTGQAGNEDTAAVAEPYMDASPLLAEVFASLDHPIVEEEFYTDSFGTFLSAYAPFYAADGRREGVIGLDISADQVAARENQLLVLILGTSLATMFVVVLIGLWLGGVFVRPIANLSRVTQQIIEGDLSARVTIETQDEIGDLAQVFNAMTSQLQETLLGLEQRVAQRTQALATSGEISRRLSSIRDRKTLAVEVVNQLQSSFNYYHAHIYLVDETKTHLVMTGGTGEAGATLLARGHKIPNGKGLVGRAAELKNTVLVADTSNDPNWLPNPLLPETKSEIAIPIMAGDELLGVLDVQNNVVNSLTQQDADLLRSIADQAAIALQNINITEAVTKRADELQKVAKVSSVASSIIDDEQKMLEQMVQLTQRQFGLYHAHVFIFDEGSQLLQIEACGWKEGDEHEGTHGTTTIPLSQEQSLVARAARNRRPVIVNNVREDAGWLPNPHLPNTAAELAVPLMAGDNLIGVLDVQSDQVDAFTEEDANIQSILASQIAVAIQNVRAFQQSKQLAKRQALIASINQQVQSATTVEGALKVVARELGRALGTRTRVEMKPNSK